jgi:hypothetical protein
MNQFNLRDRKHKHAPAAYAEVQYLTLASEPKEVTAASRGSFTYHHRYLAKRRLMRTLRRLRRGQVQ